MKISLHVGLPKTGTTSFQAYMMKGYSAASRDGIYYPSFGLRSRDPSHSWLGDALRSGDLEKLAESLSIFEGRGDHIVLSDENVYVETPGLPKKTRQAVRAIMQGHEVSVIAVTRESHAWMRSFYLQSVEMRRSGKTFDHPSANQMWQSPLPLKEFFEQDYARRVLDYPRVRDDIADMFNASNVVEVAYETNKDILKTMKPVLGLTYASKQAAFSSNPSLSDVEGEVMRQANGQRQVDGRMIRALIYDLKGTPMRPRLREALSRWAPSYRWEQIAFRENPPLQIGKGEFGDLVRNLQERAEELCRGS